MRKRGQLWKALRNSHHWHLCGNCQRVYSDTCTTPEVNSEWCRYCDGMDRPVWVLDRDPRRCCSQAEQVTSLSTRGSYKLAGETPWALCPTCKRTSIYRP